MPPEGQGGRGNWQKEPVFAVCDWLLVCGWCFQDMPASVLEACCCDAAISAEREQVLEEAAESGIDLKKRSRRIQQNMQGLMHTAFGQFRGKGTGEAGDGGGEWDLSFNDLVAGYATQLYLYASLTPPRRCCSPFMSLP